MSGEDAPTATERDETSDDPTSVSSNQDMHMYILYFGGLFRQAPRWIVPAVQFPDHLGEDSERRDSGVRVPGLVDLAEASSNHLNKLIEQIPARNGAPKVSMALVEAILALRECLSRLNEWCNILRKARVVVEAARNESTVTLMQNIADTLARLTSKLGELDAVILEITSMPTFLICANQEYIL